MRLPRIFRTTPFRLTLLFLALFAAAAWLFRVAARGTPSGARPEVA